MNGYDSQRAVQLVARAWILRTALACALWMALIGSTLAQNHRSAWMWSSASHPFGAANVLGDVAIESELAFYFDHWGFDRIYTSFGNLPLSDPATVARWNARLDDAGKGVQMLLGEPTWTTLPNRNNLLSLIQDNLIDFNLSREDPRERFDGLHLDIEPHTLGAWQSGTPADRRDLLFELRDTYIAVRELLDDNGASEVEIWADLPVWFDGAASIGWADVAQRDQWFDDIAGPLAGITLMAFERGTLSHIVSGVGWEVSNFNADVRIGLNANEVGPGDTFEDYDEFIGMANALEMLYGPDISGIDFQPLDTYTDLAPTPSPGDFDGDGDTDGDDFLTWQAGYGSGTSHATGDADFDGDVDGDDFLIWQAEFGVGLSGSAAVPEPAGALLAGLAALWGISVPVRRRWQSRANALANTGYMIAVRTESRRGAAAACGCRHNKKRGRTGKTCCSVHRLY